VPAHEQDDKHNNHDENNGSEAAYWKPPFYLLEDDIECWVVNARDVKNVPGRAKTDKLDSVWLAKLAERGMLRASFIPSRPQRQLRDLTRYRRTLTQERTREKQRAEKLLEDAQLTELLGRIAVSGGSARGRAARFPAHDQRRGWAAGSVVAEGAALRGG
jgi:transposase